MNFPLKDNTEWTLPDNAIEIWKKELRDMKIVLLDKKDWENAIAEAHFWCFKMNEPDTRRKLKTARGMKRFLLTWIANSPDVNKPNPAIDREKQWEKQCGEWLRQATLFDIQGNNSFMDMLRSVPGFRTWAEKENELVKEIE